MTITLNRSVYDGWKIWSYDTSKPRNEDALDTNPENFKGIDALLIDVKGDFPEDNSNTSSIVSRDIRSARDAGTTVVIKIGAIAKTMNPETRDIWKSFGAHEIREPPGDTEDLIGLLRYHATRFGDMEKAGSYLEAETAGPWLDSRKERKLLVGGLDWGGEILRRAYQELLYSDWKNWEKTSQEQPYKSLHDAFPRAVIPLLPKIPELVRERGITDVIPIATSPWFDILALEQLLEQDIAPVYRFVDISEEATTRHIKEVSGYFAEKYGTVPFEILESMPTDVVKMRSRDRSLVLFDGHGTIMNDINYWRQSARLAQPGGLVVASAALTPDTNDPRYSSYWESLYNKPGSQNMFTAPLNNAPFEELWRKIEEGAIEFVLSYETAPNRTGDRAYFESPRMEAQLKVHKETTVHIRGMPITFYPTRTWEEENAFANERRLTRKELEHAIRRDPQGMMRQIEERMQIQVKTSPKVLGLSAKVSPDRFFGEIPEHYGLRALETQTEELNYQHNGVRGLVGAGIFEALGK
jgi:hypothetical protein